MRRVRSSLARGVALATLFSFTLTSCGGSRRPAAPGAPAAASPPIARALALTADLPPGLDLRVSAGRAGPAAFDRARLAPAKPLTDKDADALLARTRPLAADPDDRQAFAFRPRSQPAPRAGTTVTGTFPPPPSSQRPPPAASAAEPLRVLRWMPEGKVPLAPELSITFSQPMVAVTSQTDAAATQPVRLTPTPPGSWRWIGTRTIVFDPTVRFPQATTYTVEIPAGTRSAAGATLDKPARFTFETPPPRVVASYPSPHEPQPTDAAMLAVFDQRIDPAAVLSHIAVTADGKPVAVRPLTSDEIAADKPLASLVAATTKDGQEGRWVAFRARDRLPTNSGISISIGAGTPSAEGPNPTRDAQAFSFRTYPPLAVSSSRCGYDGRCAPGTPFEIELTNPLDGDAFDPAQVVVTPAIRDQKIMQVGSQITITGLTAAQTSYTVTLAAALRDRFDQQLGKDTPVTFRVGDAYPTFFGPSGMVVLDPAAARPTLDFFTTNYEHLKVQLRRVTPRDHDAYLDYVRNQWDHDKPPRPPGTVVFDKLVATRGGKNALSETSLDLAPALTKGRGHVLAIVEPTPWPHPHRAPRMIAWVQATRLGVDAHVDADRLVARVTDLATGAPATGTSVEIAPFGIRGTTDSDGLASLGLGKAVGRALKGAHTLVARRGDDVAFVTEHDGTWNENGSWIAQPRATQLAWYVVDDRKLYKPGEEVSLTGWLRALDTGLGGDLGALAGAVTSIDFAVRDSRNNEIAKGSVPISAVGGFAAKFTLPKTPNLGYARVELLAKGGRMAGTYTHAFQVEEFRRPEFSVAAKASQGPFVVGGAGDVTVDATYYAGGPLPGAPVRWEITAARTSYTPPNRDDYTFGEWTPWWGYGGGGGYHGRGGYRGGGGDDGSSKSWSLAGVTDATGAHTLHLDFLSANPALPMAVTTNATVTDVNRQAWSAATPLIVHPAMRYVGVKLARQFVERGAPFELEAIGVDLDGKVAVGAPIHVRTARLDWELRNGIYAQKEVEPQICELTAAAAPGRCTFATDRGGSYQLVATIVDAEGRANQTRMTYWVSGGDRPPARDVEQERVELVPSAKTYAAGDTAELLVQAPFYPAEGIVSWRRSGMVKTERITLTGPTTTIRVPITERMVPNLVVQVDLVGTAARTNDLGVADPKLPRRPAYAVGTIDLPVPPTQRTLAVAVAPRVAKLGPGETTDIALTVRDAAGRPVANADASVIVVDEAILALAGYSFPDPIATFYGRREAGVRDRYGRAYVKLARPAADMLVEGAASSGPGGGGVMQKRMPMAMESMAAPSAAPIADAAPREEKADASNKGRRAGNAADAQSTAPIAIRSNFNPLAAFAPAVRTDASGRATVPVKLPDNLTRYRIIAIAAAGGQQFGKGESALTARLPLMVRPSPPRFLNFGDRFELPVVVQNQTDAPMTVRVAVRATNAALTAGRGREVTVPPNDRVEVRFPAAAELAGTARFQLVGAAGRASDAAEVALPVWTPATSEAFATYGVIDRGVVAQKISLPGKVVTQFGGLDVQTASTNLQSLTDALLYLVRYPFECAEQRASRVAAIAALRDVLTAFKTAELPKPAALEASVTADVERLSQMQNSDGGYAFWDRGYPSIPYLSVYVTDALVRAKAKGFAVPQRQLDAAKGYLANIEARYPPYYAKEVRWAISAYALATRKLLGDLDIAKGQKLMREATLDKMSMETAGWLLAVFAGSPRATSERAAIVRHALNRVSEKAGAANFTTSYGDGAYTLLASDRRVDAVMLDALIQEQPKLDLIPKLVTGLLGHRKAGRWLSTQENAFVLVALDRYFDTYEKTTPDFVARVWLGADYAGEHAFKGRTTETFALPIPMTEVAKHDGRDLTIQKDGAGRLYYRVGMTYAPASLQLAAADYGFVVQRRYEGADDPRDVVRQADGSWKIKAGARVRVVLTMVNENRRYHVALVDPLPAGLEPMNPALATTGPIPLDPGEQSRRGAYWWWYGPWYEHQNLRDERVEAFASLLWEGVHRYEYVARATTPGVFVVPPTKAEEMYMPETFGRSASDKVVVE